MCQPGGMSTTPADRSPLPRIGMGVPNLIDATWILVTGWVDDLDQLIGELA